jgi:hypothetical protein
MGWGGGGGGEGAVRYMLYNETDGLYDAAVLSKVPESNGNSEFRVKGRVGLSVCYPHSDFPGQDAERGSGRSGVKTLGRSFFFII